MIRVNELHVGKSEWAVSAQNKWAMCVNELHGGKSEWAVFALNKWAMCDDKSEWVACR